MPSVVQSTYGENGIPNVGRPGEIALDFATKRLYFYNILGQPVYISQQIDNFSVNKQYVVGDVVIYQNNLWQAKNATSIPGPFVISDWNLLTTSMPSGGDTHQVLRKRTDVTGETEWHTMTIQIGRHNGQDVVVIAI